MTEADNCWIFVRQMFRFRSQVFQRFRSKYTIAHFILLCNIKTHPPMNSLAWFHSKCYKYLNKLLWFEKCFFFWTKLWIWFFFFNFIRDLMRLMENCIIMKSITEIFCLFSSRLMYTFIRLIFYTHIFLLPNFFQFKIVIWCWIFFFRSLQTWSEIIEENAKQPIVKLVRTWQQCKQ